MDQVAIVGAGELGGLLAYVLARRALASDIALVDEHGRVAEGKALDIVQAAPIEGFSARVSGYADLSRAAGAAIVVLADAFGATEWRGDAALQLVDRLRQSARQALFICAGSAARELVERGARELRIPNMRLIGSAPEALAGGVRAMIALELNLSSADVSVSVLGVPPDRLVVPWEDASAAGLSLSRTIAPPARRRLESRVAAIWPPGPYALAAAAAKVIAIVLGRSRRIASCFVAPDDESGTRVRAAALPVRLGPNGVEVVQPTLSVRERVLLENAMML